MRTSYNLSFTRVLLLLIIWVSPVTFAQNTTSDSKAIGVEQIKAVDHVGEQRYALVIGINDYEDSEIPDLKTGENDARVMYELLTDPSSGGVDERNAYLLLGEEATTRNIRIHLNKLRQIPSQSTVFIYFSGHGAREGDGACWVTQDCSLEVLGATGITHIEVQQFISRIPSDRVVVMLDCCYAAATVKEGKAIEGDFSDVLSKFTGKGRAYLMAAGSGQEAIEAKDLKHSVFTYYLVEGMRGKADTDEDGVVVLTELTRYIDSTVADEARVRGGVQRPVVRMDNVIEPSKFGLTIDAERIARNVYETEEAKALRDKRLSSLRAYYLDEKLSLEIYQLSMQLLRADVVDLDDIDRAKLAEVVLVADGNLEPDRLQRALDAIETPQQRKARLQREARDRAEQERKDKFGSLMSQAKSKDSRQAGTEALNLLEEALKLYPGDAQALALQKKIRGYFGPNPGDVMSNSIGMKLVWIPPGEFMMGSPSSERDRGDDERQHRVRISRGFWMGQTEVTQGQWQSVMGNNPRHFKGTDLPVEQVSWDEAVEFCGQLSRQEGKTYRLPTEAEWEYACRAGTTTPFNTGETINTDQANYDGNYTYGSGRKGVYRQKTVEVGSFSANAFGLYDMHGNVYEWCNDWYGENYYSSSPGVDPQGSSSGAYRVLRGGSWHSLPRFCRSAIRRRGTPDLRFSGLGFRVVSLDF